MATDVEPPAEGMSERPSHLDRRSDPRTARDGRPPDLQLTVVEYEERPDRGTIHPHEATDIELMATWLSADRSTFVDLTACR